MENNRKTSDSGSALIIVLGMVAVLMIMAVAFSTFMRTERSGVTNLKHAITARQTTSTAIARVMAAIDESFGSPVNNAAVANWNSVMYDENSGGDAANVHYGWTDNETPPPGTFPAAGIHPWSLPTKNIIKKDSDDIPYLDWSGILACRTNRLPFIASHSGLNSVRYDNGNIVFRKDQNITEEPPLFWQSALIIHDEGGNFENKNWIEDRKNNARVLTKEMSAYLTPSQLALMRNAKIGWVPVYSGVGSDDFNQVMNAPQSDQLIARYAWIAFDTTGLLDMNVGGGTLLKDDIIKETSLMRLLQDERTGNPDKDFLSTRENSGFFNSFAELWRNFRTKKLGNDDVLVPYRFEDDNDGRSELAGGNDENWSDGYYPDGTVVPDLFATSYMSLDPLDPDGKMKLPIPANTTNDNWRTVSAGNAPQEKKNFAELALEKFKRVFRDENEHRRSLTQGVDDELQLFRTGGSLPPLTRSELATQSLIDYLDPDDIPDGGIVSSSGASHLDYPCTEDVPMITAAYAMALFDDSKPAKEQNGQEMVATRSFQAIGPLPLTQDPQVRRLYPLTLNAFVVARTLSGGSVKGYELNGTVEFPGFQTRLSLLFQDDPSVGSLTGSKTQKKRELFYENGDKVIFNSPEIKAFSGCGTDADPIKLKFMGFSEIARFRLLAVIEGDTDPESNGPTSNATRTRTIIVKVKPIPPTWDANNDGVIDWADWAYDPTVQEYDYDNDDYWYKPIELDENNYNIKRLDFEARFTAKITKEGDDTVVFQQIPAPALHNPNTRLSTDTTGFTGEPVRYKEDYRVKVLAQIWPDRVRGMGATPEQAGWAFPIDPRFGYNTTCFLRSGRLNGNEQMISWISNALLYDPEQYRSAPSLPSFWSSLGSGIRPNQFLEVIPRDDQDFGFYRFLPGVSGPGPNTIPTDHPVFSVLKNRLFALSNISPRGDNQHAGDINPLTDNVLFMKKTGALNPNDARRLMQLLAGGGLVHNISGIAVDQANPIYPDFFHISPEDGRVFIEKTDSDSNLLTATVANTAMTSLGEFGSLLIGPWETLSLFATLAPGGTMDTAFNGTRTDETTGERFRIPRYKVDFHRVADYFTLSMPRSPTIEEILGGAVAPESEYRGTVDSAKLNLNPQQLVRYQNVNSLNTYATKPLRENNRNRYNYEPLAVLLGSADSSMSFDTALDAAESIYSDVVRDSGTFTQNNIFGNGADTMPALTGNNDGPFVFNNISSIGNIAMINGQPFAQSPLLHRLVSGAIDSSDRKREEYLGKVLDNLTSRGQSFTVIIRSDAYSPKYGTDSAMGGTTLATEYAIVELWRDSEPNRHPDGKIYPLGMNANSISNETDLRNVVHGWHVRSVRYFSP